MTDPSDTPRLGRATFVILVLGTGLLATGWLGDVAMAMLGLGRGAPGMGRKQWALIGVGAALLAAAWISSRRLRRGVRALWAAAPSASVPTGVRLGWWWGLLTGLIELSILATKKLGNGAMIHQPMDVVWMAPASYGVVLAVTGALLGLLGRFVRLPGLTAPMVLLAVWSQLRTFGWLHLRVVWALGLLVAWQLARPAHVAGLNTLARRTVVPVTALWLVVVGVVLFGWGRRGAPPATPPPSGAPNVLLVVLDTVRADRLGTYGYGLPTTPAIDALAQRGTVFDWAISPSPWTLPAHASIFTGKYPQHLSANWLTPLDDAEPTLAERFAAAGYHTAGFVGNLAYCTAETGLARGFAHYEDDRVTPATIAFSTSLGRRVMAWLGYHSHFELVRNDAETVSSGFLRWVDRHDDRPFFAFLNYFDAHNYYLPPPPFDEGFGAVSPLVRSSLSMRRQWTDAEIAGVGAGYDGCLAFIDHWIARLEQDLAARGVLDDTIVVITGDHGEQFGEHGLMGHGNSLYRSVLHVPLILVQPGAVPAGQRVPAPVSLRDLGATLIDLAGIDAPFPGHSLAPTWRGAPASDRSPAYAEVSKTINMPRWHPASTGDLYTLFQDGYQLVRHPGEEQLYGLDASPNAEADLSTAPAHAQRRAAMSTALDALR
ncbi:MAG: sulfatase [Planctomycetota bacterium]